MPRAFTAFIAALLTALASFLFIYVGTQSFDYAEGDYLDRNGEYVDLRPWVLAPIQTRDLLERYPGRPVIALLIATVAALAAAGLSALSTESRHSPARSILTFAGATVLGFLGFLVCVQYLGFQLWGFEMLLAVCISSGLAGYMLIATLSAEGFLAHLGNVILVLVASVLCIITLPVLRLLAII
jgi:hypothetical protein